MSDIANNEVQMGLTQGVNDIQMLPGVDNKKRGVNIYSYSQLIGITGRGKAGDLLTTTYDNPYFYLSPEDRVKIAKLCTPVLGVVTSRQNRIAATKWVITNNKKNEDKIYERLKSLYSVYTEYKKATDITYIIASARIWAQLRVELIELLPDASNFEGCLIRWRKKNKLIAQDRNNEIEDWLSEPNANDKWEDFIKKWVFDDHIHGCTALYKEAINNKIENVYILPGGTTIPVRDRYISSLNAYIQIIDGFEPQIFFNNELSFSQYIPNSSSSYPLVPLEALINKVAETMFFDKLMADQADGTKPPEKCIIINDMNPFGNIDKDLVVPIDINEQKRIEEKINTPIKGAIMTFTGNQATLIDLSRENTMSIQMQRQKDIREEVAVIFNMSSMEVNLTGSEDVSGRACYSEDTQTLTENGWKYFHEIKDNEKIACFNPESKEMIYEKPIKKCIYDYSGDMISFKNNRMDILVTPDHRMYSFIPKNYDETPSKRKNKVWKKIRADILIKKSLIRFKNICDWNSEKEIKNFDITDEILFNGDNFLEFLGYYLSEGCLYSYTNKNENACKKVIISQNIGTNSNIIESCLNKLAINYCIGRQKNHNQFIISNIRLYDYLLKNFNKYSNAKKIPFEFRQLSKRQLRILFNALMLGDGHWINYKDIKYGSYHTISKELADNVSDIAIKLGYSVYIRTRQTYKDINGTNHKEAFTIHFCKRNFIQIIKKQIKKIKYTGTVYCFQTNSGLFFTKRNGKIAIQGNTSESQSDIEQSKGTAPHLRRIERIISKEILPFRFGWGYLLEFQATKNELEEVQLSAAKIASGKYSVDEVREEDNLMPYGGEFAKPQGANQSMGSELKPLNFKNISEG